MKENNQLRAIKIINKYHIRNKLKNEYKEDVNDEKMNQYINCFINETEIMKKSEGENRDNVNTVKFYE